MTRDTMHKNNCLLRHSWNLTELQYLPIHAKDFAYDLSLWSQNCLTTIITWWIWLRCQMQGQLLQHLTVKLFLGREFMGYSTIAKVTKKKPEEKVSQKNISEHSRILMEKMDWKFNLWTRNLVLNWRSWLLFLRGSSCGKYVIFLLKLGRLKHVCSTWNMLILV